MQPFEELLPEYDVVIRDDEDDFQKQTVSLLNKSKLQYIYKYV